MRGLMRWHAMAFTVPFAFFTLFGVFAGCDDRPRSQCLAACVMNLRAIEGAKATWALENRKTTNDVPTDADLFGADRYIRDKPQCPRNGTYTLGKVGEKPTCSVRGHTY
jgi:hypothetical protein